MVSQEFKSAIASQNLLRTRIMLKDSFVVDPTFDQFNEMLAYALRESSGIMVPFDGGFLEDDSSKWNRDVMNMELVQLVNNFSDERIEHLKKVVTKVMDTEIQTIKKQRMAQNRGSVSQNSFKQSECTPKSMEKAWKRMTKGGEKICNLMCKHNESGRWDLKDVQEMEFAAKQILSATKYLNK